MPVAEKSHLPRGDQGVRSLLANDLVIQESNCNLSCKYCLTGQSKFKADHLDQLIFQPPSRSDCGQGTALGAALERIVVSTVSRLDLPIAKVTGGEIFLIKGIIDFIERLAGMVSTVVVQTNGVLIKPDQLERLAALENMCLQVSLDSTEYSGNSYRSGTPALHDKIFNRLHRIFSAGIPIEIYCVLNDRSLPQLETTLAVLRSYGPHLTIFPFPIRGPDRDDFYPRPEQIHILHRILDRYDEFLPVMPPRAYWRRLISYFEEGGRTFRCHLPRFAFTTFEDGQVTSCPNIWFNKIGNLLSEPPEDVTQRIGNTPFHQILLAPKPRLDACRSCFTPWDMLSMFLDGEITLDELCEGPMYRSSATRVRLQQIAADYYDAKV
ncbi:radical SAM protein [Bradyrhizobium diazoefficiens]|uniref:radical SAM protein n=1 Tax=Bradyrhizobium diazoefficiens TaxID=1355477 RepID=UPI001B8C18A5|nr:radical SAM protein [Bradyrhizobium diazoefficiens]MBR0865890.1 radical SAM protein [Bradyrhizobium diazoefficiens]MBR0890420.1 radical SAM protein [Bradyrhizobium diazoefficiens]MBR0922190.1 radical SAM protein [Bradyrhizobium diazoefficiens]